MTAFGPHPVTHFGFGVADIAAAVDDWVETVGAGPFVRIGAGPLPLEGVSHRGAPATWSHTTATGQWGEVMIELSENDAASPPSLAEAIGVGEIGLHHVGWFAEDLDAESARLEAAGAPPILVASRGEQQIRFFDAHATFGVRIEIYQPQAPILAHYALLREAAAKWDGEGERLFGYRAFAERFAD